MTPISLHGKTPKRLDEEDEVGRQEELSDMRQQLEERRKKLGRWEVGRTITHWAQIDRIKFMGGSKAPKKISDYRSIFGDAEAAVYEAEQALARGERGDKDFVAAKAKFIKSMTQLRTLP